MNSLLIAVIPDDGSHGVGTRFQIRSQIDGLIEPVMQIAERWTYGYQLVVDIKLIAVIGRYLYVVFGWHRFQFQLLLEFIDTILAEILIRHTDPISLPNFLLNCIIGISCLNTC